MDARDQRALARRNMRETVEKIPAVLAKKIRWNRTLRSQTFSRSEIRYLYVFAFQVPEVEAVLQRLKFLR